MSSLITFREFKLLSIAIALAFCGSIGLDIQVASLPYIMHYMHTDKQHVQQSISLFILGVGLSMLIYGPLSDKLGRKPVVIFGLSVACLTSYAATLTHHITPFLIMRILQGVGSGVCWGIGRIIVADVLQAERLAAVGSYFTLFLSLSPLLAPTLGGYMQHWFGWQSTFILLGSIILLVLLIFIIWFEETNQHKRPKAFHLGPLLKTYSSFFRHRLFIGCTLLSGIGMAANMIYTTVSSFIFQQQFHTSVIVFGWLTASVGIAGILGKLFSPFFILRLKSRKALFLGICFLLAGGLLLALFALIQSINIPIVLLGVALAIFAQVFIGSIVMSMALSPFHDKRGAAGALYSSFQLLIAFACSSVVANLAHSGTTLLASSYVILGIFSLFCYFVLMKQNSITP